MKFKKKDYRAFFACIFKRKPRLSNTRAIVIKDGFPCGDKAVYSPSLFKFNSLVICAMPFERAIYPMVLKRNSISFSSSAPSLKNRAIQVKYISSFHGKEALFC